FRFLADRGALMPPFGDDVADGPQHVPTLVLHRCRRCSALLHSSHADATIALRRAVEAGELTTIHACDDGASGVADLVGCGPGVRHQLFLAPEPESATDTLATLARDRLERIRAGRST